MLHLPPPQLIFPSEPFDIMGQDLPSLPLQQSLPLQDASPEAQHLAPLPEQAIFPFA